MKDLLHELLTLLQLERLEENLFVGESQELGWGRVYGGQVIGQAIVAATQTVTDRRLHSMHGYFLRPGDTRKSIQYRVERVRDGGSFSSRRVVAWQSEKVIFTMMASFQIPEEGLEHQIEMPHVPGPDELISELEMRRAIAHKIPEAVRAQFTCDRPVEFRPVDPISLLHPEKRPPNKCSWIRAVGKMPDDLTLNQCLLAYTSDWGILGTSLLPHQLNVASRNMQAASIDHAMWFHRDFRMDDWLLYVQDSPSSSHGRGFSRGNIFSKDGKLVASVCQEGLIRIKPNELQKSQT